MENEEIENIIKFELTERPYIYKLINSPNQKYFNYLQSIRHKDTSKQVYIIIDASDYIYKYNSETQSFVTMPQYHGEERYITDIYSDVQLLDLDIKETNMYDLDRYNSVIFRKAKEELLVDLAKAYISLDLELDACQGCTDNVDVELEKVSIYSDIAYRYFGVVLSDHIPMLSKWYYAINKINEAERKDKQSKKVAVPMELITNKDDIVTKTLLDLCHKFNAHIENHDK